MKKKTTTCVPVPQLGWWSLQDGSHGPLGVVTSAREVRLDALKGRLFWTTSHALLTSTLAGRNVTTLHQEGIFSGKQGRDGMDEAFLPRLPSQ